MNCCLGQKQPLCSWGQPAHDSLLLPLLQHVSGLRGGLELVSSDMMSLCALSPDPEFLLRDELLKSTFWFPEQELVYCGLSTSCVLGLREYMKCWYTRSSPKYWAKTLCCVVREPSSGDGGVPAPRWALAGSGRSHPVLSNTES